MKDSTSEISQKVLFVDDEQLLLEGIKRQLRREFDISVAEGGEAGLDILSDQGPFAVVVSDYNMPGMNGIQFLSRVKENHPDTILVHTSAPFHSFPTLLRLPARLWAGWRSSFVSTT